jgi:hypothetical protein
VIVNVLNVQSRLIRTPAWEVDGVPTAPREKRTSMLRNVTHRATDLDERILGRPRRRLMESVKANLKETVFVSPTINNEKSKHIDHRIIVL